MMDGLDTYIDDYTNSEPIPEPLLARHSCTPAYIIDPPSNALNAEGRWRTLPTSRWLLRPASFAVEDDE